jgi:hypothetical protein
MGSGLSDTCRDAGMFSLNSTCMSGKLILEQDCGIRNKGPSAECCQHAQQPKPYGSSRLRSRGTSPFPQGGGFRLLTLVKDREAEPRFTGGPPRGEFGAGRGGFGGGFGGGGFGAGAAGRQLYVNNVGFLSPYGRISKAP